MDTISPATLADSPRARVQGSTRLLSEWLALFRRGLPAFHQLRLGATTHQVFGVQLDPAIDRMLRRHNRYADAVVVTPAAIEVIEAKPVADPAALSQVRLYAKLVGQTPELANFLDRPVKAIALFGTYDPHVAQEGSELGVDVITYSPPWLNEYLNERYYRTRAPQTASA